jgi:type IV pilus assembly protein PilP
VIQPIAPQQPVKPETPAPAAEQLKEPAYTYRPAGRRDPFAPIIVREEKKEQKGAVPPLERYAVAEFKLTGIVWGGFGYNAVLEGPDGKGYFVRAGTVIGQNRGAVKRITKDSMIVEEKFKNYMGVTERKEIVVTLRKKQEGLP